MRLLLHKVGAEPSEGRSSNLDDVDSSRNLVRKVVKESLGKINDEPVLSERSIRWELGSCWVQHLQKQETSDKSSLKKENGNEVEQAVKGLGKQFKLLRKREKKPSSLDSTDFREQNDSRPGNAGIDKAESNNDNLGSSAELEKNLSGEAFLRLKESATGLHLKVCERFWRWVYFLLLYSLLQLNV